MGTPTSMIEREVKFEADLAFTVPDLRDLVGGTVRLPEQHLWATYFDTPDLLLWSRGITLRHRRGEDPGSGLWTLKLPHDNSGPALERTELSWPGSVDALPPEASAILMGIVRGSGLREIAQIETTRRRLALQGRGTEALGELDDDTVTIHGGPHDGLQFRQIELEIGSADRELTDALLERFIKAGANFDESGPKLARAVDPRATGHDGEARTRIGKRSSLGEVVQASIAKALDRILDHEYWLRIESERQPPRHIHQARVASRHLRSDVKTFESVLDPVWVRHVRDDLKWLGKALGEVRDLDVLARHVEEQRATDAVDSDGAAQLASMLDKQRDKAVSQLARVLASDQYLQLLDKLHAAAESPPFRGSEGLKPSTRRISQRKAAKVLPRLVRRPWKKLRREARRIGRNPTDLQLHRLRIRAKQLRYAAETAEPVVGKSARQTAKAAADLQTLLGLHHDAVVAEQRFRQLADHGSPLMAFAAGQLASEQHRVEQQVRRHWLAAEKKVTSKRHHRWLL